MYFEYGKIETDYLSLHDKKLGAAIEKIGHIQRAVDQDLFSSVVHHIIGQQISTVAQQTIWQRLSHMLPTVNEDTILSLNRAELQSIGITFKKADYIIDFSNRVQQGIFHIEALRDMPDDAVIKELCTLKGIGVWTAEMIMTFSLQRPDIVSYGDLAILRGMRMLYRHREIDKAKFDRYRKRYTPYGTVAAMYLWAIAGGALPELTDPAPKKVKK